MIEKGFHFNQKSFASIFPFYFLMDKHYRFLHFGDSLKKMIPELTVSSQFDHFFSFKTPNFSSELQEIAFEKLEGTLIVLTVHNHNKTFLRGQMMAYEDDLLFIGSPWVSSIEELTEKKLEMTDFAIHDTSIDMLNMLRSLEISNNDLKYMVHAITSQKRELQRDKEEIKKLSLVVSTNENGVVLSDLNGEIFWTNEAYMSMTGYREEVVLGNTLYDLGVSEMTDAGVLDSMLDAFRKAELFDQEVIHKRSDNTHFWARIKGHPVFDNLGNFIEYYTMIEDITHEKEMQDRLKESEQRLRSLILNLHDGILLEDENRKILLVNQKFCSMFGIPVAPELLIGSDCTNSAEQSKYFFKDNIHFVSRIEQILADKQSVLHEVLELVDGRVFSRSYIPVVIDNVHKGHLWTYEDISLERHFHDRLNNEKEKYRRIIENMNIGLLEVDNDDRILMANQRFCTMSGYTPEELEGKKGVDVFLNEDTKRLLTEKSQLRRSKISDSYELEVRGSDGEERVWLVSGGPNYDLTGSVIGSIGLHFDITETRNLEIQREQLLERLERQNRQLNEYAQIVSHDLKSPLRSIHSLITFIKEDNDKEFNEQTAKYFNLIQEKVEKMELLIQGILAYSKIDSPTSRRELIDLNEMIKSIESIIFIPSHIALRIKKALPTVKEDVFRMQQLFLNLISNAINYNDKPDGFVEIDVEEEPNRYIFSVRDNGIGISTRNQSRIFKMFESINGNEKSTGIGLNIVKKILENSGEEIWLISEEGVGTTFYFTLHKHDKRNPKS
ncbi:MAG: Adaptive-response sensory-kinase SasA [Bacteroidota bacterium]|jgi:PAS domain S-box-containing protein